MKKITITMGLIILSQWSFAQEHHKNQYVLDSLLVKSKQQNKSFINNAQATGVVTAELVERNNPNYIEQSLGSISGVQVDKRTQYGGQRVVVRGYGNDQKFNNWGVKFYLNGTPITNADGTSILEDIDFSLINNIEVVKGPAATLYGGGTGGAVQFNILPTFNKGVQLSQNTMVGSFNTFNSNTRLEVAGKKYNMLFNYGHLQSDGYRPRGNTNKNNYTFLGNVQLNSNQKLMVYASHNNSYEGITGQISTEDYRAGKDPGNAAYARRNSHNHFISNRFILNHLWQITPNIKNNTSLFYHSLNVERAAAGAFGTSENPNYGFRTVFSGDFNLGKDLTTQVKVGAEHLISTSLSANYRFNGGYNDPPLQTKPIDKGSFFHLENYNTSFFASNRLFYQPLKVSLITGVSANTLGYQRRDLLAFPGLLAKKKQDISFSKSFPVIFTPHIAIQKQWDNHIVNLSYSEGYNAPTSKTAYINATGKTNDNLKPEYAKMWDLTAQGGFFDNHFNYQISLFDIHVKDKLTELSATDANNILYTYWGNTGVQQNKGLELSLAYNYEPNTFLKAIKPFANVSVYDFKYTHFSRKGNDYSGNKVVGVPTVKYTLGLDFISDSGLYLQNTFNYLGDVYTDFSNKNLFKGFGLLNAKLGYKKQFGQWTADAYIMGNNLTSQINYTYLFVGSAVGDSDIDNGYPSGTVTDINPGAYKAYFMGGLNLSYHF